MFLLGMVIGLVIAGVVGFCVFLWFGVKMFERW